MEEAAEPTKDEIIGYQLLEGLTPLREKRQKKKDLIIVVLGKIFVCICFLSV